MFCRMGRQGREQKGELGEGRGQGVDTHRMSHLDKEISKQVFCILSRPQPSPKKYQKHQNSVGKTV